MGVYRNGIAKLGGSKTFTLRRSSATRRLLCGTALSGIALLTSFNALAQQRGPVTEISEAAFLSEMSGNDWLFDSGVSGGSDYAQLQPSALAGVPGYESPAHAPAPTDSLVKMPAPVAVAPINTARRPLKDLGGTVGASSDQLAGLPSDLAQAGGSALDETIDGADSPALPAYMNPDNSAGGLSSAAGLDGLPALPPIQPVTAAPLPPSLSASVDAGASADLGIAGGGGPFDPYAYTQEQSAASASPAALNARTVAEANTPVGDLPSLPPVEDVRVGGPMLPGVGANARSLPAGSTGSDGDLPAIEDALEGIGLADEDLVVQIGGGVVFRPDYVGSDDMEVQFKPIVDIEYRDRLFLSTERGIGLQVIDNSSFDLAVFADWRRGRGTSGDLSGFDKRSGSVTAGADAGISFGPMRLGVRADYGLTGDMKGLEADVEASFTQAVDVFLFQLYGGAKLGDSTYIDNRFGYAANEGGHGQAAFTGDGGLVDVHGGVTAKYFLTPNFAIEANVEGAQIMGDAADSYIVKDLGNVTQYEATLGASYKF